MPQVESPTRCTIQIPGDIAEAVDSFAERVHLSRNKAAAALLRLGLKAEQDRFKRIRKLTDEIRHAATDEEAEKYNEELMQIVFGSSQRDAR